jgi:hypothetical protein
MTTPLSGWGRSTWNNATWNEDGTVDATGVSLTSSVNDVGQILSIDVTPTGVSATASTELQIREGWNRGLNVGDSIASSFGWSNGAWGNGDNTVSVTGIGLTSSLGDESVTGGASVTLPSVSLTATAGDAVATGIAEVTASGVSLTSSFGSFTIATDQNISVSGNGLTSSLGDESVGTTSTTGWNRDTDLNTGNSIGWGDQQWGTVGITNVVSGFSLPASLGTPTLTTDQNISVTGIALTSSIGDPAIRGDSNLSLTGVGLTSSTGDLPTTVDVAGNALTLSLGTVETSVFLTGLGMQATLGDAEQETIYTIDGVSATTGIGTVNVSISNIFTISGVSATTSLGNLQGTFWSEVDDSNSGISWTEVHKAA